MWPIFVSIRHTPFTVIKKHNEQKGKQNGNGKINIINQILFDTQWLRPEMIGQYAVIIDYGLHNFFFSYIWFAIVVCLTQIIDLINEYVKGEMMNLLSE